MSQKKKRNLKINLGDREEVRVVEEFEILKSYSFSRNDEDKNGVIGHIHYGDIHTTFLSTINSQTTIPKLKNNLNISSEDYLKEGDIIIADASEDYNDLGKSIYIDDTKKINLISGLHTFSLRPKKLNKINSIYFKFYTQSKTYKKIMKKIGTGTSVFGITKSNLLNLKIPSCDVKTQNKIADFLSSIDILIEKQEECICVLKKKKKITRNKLLHNKLNFNDIPNQYQIVNFEEIFYKEKIQTKVFKKDYLNEGNIPIISQEKKLINGYIDNKNTNENCILLGDHTLILKYCNFPFVTGGDGVILLKSNYNIKFSFYLLEEFLPNPEGYKRHFSRVKEMKFNLPNLKEQNKIANLLSSMDNLIELNQKKLKQLKLKKKYYLNEIFG